MAENHLKPSASIEFNKKAVELQKQGNKIINLSIGQPSFSIDESIKINLKEAIASNYTFYTISQGIEPLRTSILDWRNWSNKYTIDNVLITPGAKSAIFSTLKSILSIGDEVIVFAPYWVSYIELIHMCDGVPKIVKTNKDFSINIDELKKAINSKTKALIINNPNNPSGNVVDVSLMKEIVHLTKESNLYLIADEVYSSIIFEKEFTSFADIFDISNENIIVIDSVSKSLSCTGLRIGYVIANKSNLNRILMIHQHLNTCAGSIEQVGLSKVTKTKYIQIISKYNNEYIINRDCLLNAKIVREVATVPHGSFYMLLNIKNKYKNSYEAANYLLEKFGIATVPGEAYGIDDYVRISFAGSLKDIEQFIELVEKNNLL